MGPASGGVALHARKTIIREPLVDCRPRTKNSSLPRRPCSGSMFVGARLVRRPKAQARFPGGPRSAPGGAQDFAHGM